MKNLILTDSLAASLVYSPLLGVVFTKKLENSWLSTAVDGPFLCIDLVILNNLLNKIFAPNQLRVSALPDAFLSVPSILGGIGVFVGTFEFH